MEVDLERLKGEADSCRREASYGDMTKLPVHVQNLYTAIIILIDVINSLQQKESTDT